MYLAKVNILHGEKDQAIIPGFKAWTPELCLPMLEKTHFRNIEIYCLFEECGKLLMACLVYKQKT